MPFASSTVSSVGGTVRTLAILEFVTASQTPVSAADIARATGLNSSTSFNITRTLAGAGYLRLVEGTRFYTTGPAMLALAHKASNQTQPNELVKMPMQALANRFEVDVSLWRRTSRYCMTMLLATENRAATRIQVGAGVRLPLLTGSMGRLMAMRSDLSSEECRQVYAVVNAERPLAYRTFIRQSKLAAERGWSLDDGHIRTAVVSISVPVETGSPSLEYVCTATMFRGQYNKDAALEELARELTRVAAQIATVYRTGSARSNPSGPGISGSATV